MAPGATPADANHSARVNYRPMRYNTGKGRLPMTPKWLFMHCFLCDSERRLGTFSRVERLQKTSSQPPHSVHISHSGFTRNSTLSLESRNSVPSCIATRQHYFLYTDQHSVRKETDCRSRWTVQSRFAETLTLNPNPNFGESGFSESGRHLLNSRPTDDHICTSEDHLWLLRKLWLQAKILRK